jgi:membrane-associated phospholipid phosphatase
MIPLRGAGSTESREGTEQVEHPASAATDSEAGPPGLREQLDGLDRAVFRAIAATPTPSLDRAFGALSQAADHSVLWVATAALLAACGPSGRRAATDGLVAVAATSAVINLALKPLGGRRRPDPARDRVPAARQVEMPDSTSFPSGHSGSAFAFASAVANSWPPVAGPIQTLATLVAYSRVHTGVHYPGDVIVGSTVGSIVGPLASYALRRWRRSRS